MLLFLDSLNRKYSSFQKVFSISMEKTKEALTFLVNLYKNSSVYPVIKNYSINDVFNISKNILFIQGKFSYSQSTSIATDSKYLYILLSGINGGMLKVGTGFDGTEKGKVYIYKKVQDLEEIYDWVYCKGKLFLKCSSKPWYLFTYSTDTFKYEKKLKLNFPKLSLHSSVIKRNENYILLSDGEKLSTICVEPVINTCQGLYNFINQKKYLEVKLKPTKSEEKAVKAEVKNPFTDNAKKKKTDLKKKIRSPLRKVEAEIEISDEEDNTEDGSIDSISSTFRSLKLTENPTDAFSHLNLVLYTYDPEYSPSTPLDSEKEELVSELHDTFSQLFPKENCRKALSINNWDFEVRKYII